jgi:hypothetical protein
VGTSGIGLFTVKAKVYTLWLLTVGARLGLLIGLVLGQPRIRGSQVMVVRSLGLSRVVTISKAVVTND